MYLPQCCGHTRERLVFVVEKHGEQVPGDRHLLMTHVVKVSSASPALP